MSQLWAWEYEGQDEVGWRHGERTSFSLFVVRDSLVLVNRDISQVTNLRKVKVVDEDAITISKKLWGWINSSDVIYEKGWRIRERISSENPQLNTTPPVTEPKNFGAIVEAQYFGYNSEKYLKARFFNNGRDWILEGTLNNFAWSDLINPIIISEGVEG